MRRITAMAMFLAALSVISQTDIRAEYNARYGVELQNVRVTSDGFMRYITGTAVNKSSNSYSIFQLYFDLLNSDGEVVGVSSDTLVNFRAGGKWRFKVVVFEEDATRYRLSGMEAME